MPLNIPKLPILKIGDFDKNGEPIGWEFDGKSHPRSIGTYVHANGVRIYGGYTVDELLNIKILDGVK